jgi:two-component sensor histidine kinase
MSLRRLTPRFSGWLRSVGAGSAAAAPTEPRLQAALAENARLELLLGSTRHSVGNHLALLSAMLARQARSSRDAETRDIFRTAMSRVATIAETMRAERHGAGEWVDARPLVDRVARLMFEHAAAAGVSLEVEVGAFQLSADEAVPFLIILDELVVNSLKHAFPDDIGGAIRVGFGETTGPIGRELWLIVEDDGVGLKGSSPRFGAKVISSMVKTLGAEFIEQPGSADPTRPGLRSIVKTTRR